MSLSDEKTDQQRRRLSQSNADKKRGLELFSYIVLCLAAARDRTTGNIRKSETAERIGGADANKQVAEILDYKFGSGAKRKTRTKIPIKITTGYLVNMLSKLKEELETAYRQPGEASERYTKLITQEDILTALTQLIELTPEERKALGLQPGDQTVLLQQALLNMQILLPQRCSYETVLSLYKTSIGADFNRAEAPLNSLQEVEKLVEETVKFALQHIPEGRKDKLHDRTQPELVERKQKIVNELKQKVNREVKRLLAKSGNHKLLGKNAADTYIHSYLTVFFIKQLTHAVIANERLTDQFPIYIRNITIERCGPLPFTTRELTDEKEDQPFSSLLNRHLLNIDQAEDIHLASQDARRVTVYFYLKTPKNYQRLFPDIFEGIVSHDGNRIDFSISSTGCGGILSHVIKVINLALLHGNDSLRSYFPIAHDVTLTEAIIRDNVSSPIWAHSLVKLCSNEAVARAVRQSHQVEGGAYEEYAFADPIGHGDYCGFDFLLCLAQAAFQARLQAIRNIGVNPQEYLKDLCNQVERTLLLEKACSYLRFYPFSTCAMSGILEQELLQELKGSNNLKREDSYACFDACLAIVEASLDEGAYRRAWVYLKKLEVLRGCCEQGQVVVPLSRDDQGSKGEFNPGIDVFSGSLLVRYLICQAQYCYLYDRLGERKSRELSSSIETYHPYDCAIDADQETLLRKAWDYLKQAQEHVAIRLKKYVAINEISQGTFHPHYQLLARIVFLRAKLLIFFPTTTPVVPREELDHLPTDEETLGRSTRTENAIHTGRLYLLEKARLYAAVNGNDELYACYTAVHCWAYLMAAYSSQPIAIPDRTRFKERAVTLRRSDCLQWAEKMRNHALLVYADTGRRCYYEIKEKSGIAKERIMDYKYGSFMVEPIPAIREINVRGKVASDGESLSDEFLMLDMSLLGVNPKPLSKFTPEQGDQIIYLFGTNAAYLFFARGLYYLCSDELEEYPRGEPSQANQDGQTARQDWEKKLVLACRLLNTAWAIAEDGGTFEEISEASSAEILEAIPEKKIQKIIRSFKPDPTLGERISVEVSSVKDLYPRRIGEIAELGKLFAAACIVLRCHLADEQESQLLKVDFDTLERRLYGKASLQDPEDYMIRRAVHHQSRRSGHLMEGIDRCMATIRQYLKSCNGLVNEQNIHEGMIERRDKLMAEIFKSLTGLSAKV